PPSLLTLPTRRAAYLATRPPRFSSIRLLGCHLFDDLRHVRGGARLLYPVVVPRRSVPLGHDVTAIGARRRAVGRLAAASRAHLVDRAAVRARVLGFGR